MCEKCQELTEVIDELSELLSKAQKSRRKAFRDSLLYKRLLVMDMEEEHDIFDRRD